MRMYNCHSKDRGLSKDGKDSSMIISMPMFSILKNIKSCKSLEDHTCNTRMNE